MGNACCVAAHDKMVLPNTSAVEGLQRNNARYSPNWSFRWDNRGRVAGEDTSLSWLSDGISRNDGSDLKSESAFVSSQGSPLNHLQTQSWQKSPASDQSFSRNASMDTVSEQITQNPVKRSVSLASQPSSFSTSPLSSHSHLPLPPATSSSTLKLTPRTRLSKQVSDSQILGFNSPTEERLGSESHSGPSDGWSMQAFSEMMAYSRRESCSYDNECLSGLGRGKIDHQGNGQSSDQQTCGACSRPLSQKSLLSSQKIFATNELSVAAILACGHVYHSECLEQMTPEADKFDPQCPVCTLGEKRTFKLSEKALRADLDLRAKQNKILRKHVVDRDDFVMFDHMPNAAAAASGSGGHKGKVSKLLTSSSLRSYSPKPFLARHFSFGSRSNSVKSPKENHSARKKGFFWTKSSKL
ncbi:hypothetical protein BRARA_I04638 [Brassica rapa]|uniref:RING-type domain-containing protein n=2 Tax=Brassica TaxID=3705 RepID=A0A397Y3B2_BRACM|nr:hypothetical protein BRARA_I04638 [Brassica rapa]CAF2049933.1 unnamed protein product [Brassica napus]CAG7866614.1 unnamed protein product [Brassica rapa]VDC63597.1 unnamed protein product [Brassica rapa]